MPLAAADKPSIVGHARAWLLSNLCSVVLNPLITKIAQGHELLGAVLSPGGCFVSRYGERERERPSYDSIGFISNRLHTNDPCL